MFCLFENRDLQRDPSDVEGPPNRTPTGPLGTCSPFPWLSGRCFVAFVVCLPRMGVPAEMDSWHGVVLAPPELRALGEGESCGHTLTFFTQNTHEPRRPDISRGCKRRSELPLLPSFVKTNSQRLQRSPVGIYLPQMPSLLAGPEMQGQKGSHPSQLWTILNAICRIDFFQNTNGVCKIFPGMNKEKLGTTYLNHFSWLNSVESGKTAGRRGTGPGALAGGPAPLSPVYHLEANMQTLTSRRGQTPGKQAGRVQ